MYKKQAYMSSCNDIWPWYLKEEKYKNVKRVVWLSYVSNERISYVTK